MPNLKRVPLEGKNDFLSTMISAWTSSKSVVKWQLLVVRGVPETRSVNVTFTEFPGSEERKKESLFSAQSVHGIQRAQRVLFSPADNTSGIPGEFKQIARSRDYYWKSRPRMLFKQRATWRELLGRTEERLVVPRISSPKLDPESARVREKVCFKFDRSSGIYSGIYVESTSCLSPRWHGLPFHETCQKRRARPPRRSRRKGGRASTAHPSPRAKKSAGHAFAVR